MRRRWSASLYVEMSVKSFRHRARLLPSLSLGAVGRQGAAQSLRRASPGCTSLYTRSAERSVLR